MTAGIAIDPWKLPIFERHLKRAGFAYKQGPGLTSEMLMLYVITNEARDLFTVVKQANIEAASKGQPHDN
jgi:hypothetical protein